MVWYITNTTFVFKYFLDVKTDHCLYHLYSVKPRPPGAMQLRTRGHAFELPIIKYEFNKRNFIVQSLFNYV